MVEDMMTHLDNYIIFVTTCLAFAIMVGFFYIIVWGVP
jgi:hypothetical protein